MIQTVMCSDEAYKLVKCRRNPVFALEMIQTDVVAHLQERTTDVAIQYSPWR